MPNVVLQLGGITFSGLEIPEKLQWGGDQSLVVHELVGGVRVVDAMGRKDAPIEWSGYFMGSSAMGRAQYLNTQRILGQPLQLSVDALLFTVVVQSFTASYEYAYRIPYRITCAVVRDEATPTTFGTMLGIDDAISTDFANAIGLSAIVNDSALGSLMGAVGSAINAVPTFANAAQTTINSVLLPIASAQARAESLISSASIIVQDAAEIGNIAASATQSLMPAALNAQGSAFVSLPPLFEIQNTLNRMTANLNSLRATATPITVAGGDLLALASKQYGDPTSWTAIAKANGLTDPQLQGVQTLNVPMLPDTAGGVLGG